LNGNGALHTRTAVTVGLQTVLAACAADQLPVVIAGLVRRSSPVRMVPPGAAFSTPL